MKYFFMAVGFSESDAEQADAYYQQHFNDEYAPSPFSHVADVLQTLHKAGFVLGIVTANIRVNVEKALGKSWEFFDPRLRYTYDHGLTKAEALKAGAKELGVTPEEVIFVGDQLADRDAANAAGARFLGVTYGWAISPEDTGLETVHDRWELAVRLLQMAPPTDEQLKVGLEHARGMYTYHAGQRYGSFSFFGALATAIVGGIGALFSAEKIWISDWPFAPLLATILGAGAIVMLEFCHRLDKRNEHLVNCDKTLLAAVERELGIRASLPAFEILAAGDIAKPKRKHSYIVPQFLRIFQVAVLVAWIASWGYWYWVKYHPAKTDSIKIEITK
jgi:HAD superfamily hydrolase (TIGR01509 family)